MPPVAEVATAEAGPVVFDGSSRLGCESWDEYVRENSAYTSIVLLERPHPRASSTACYGINLQSRGKNASWVVDGDPARGYWLVVDADLSGDLAGDPVWTLRRADRDWSIEVSMPPRVDGGPPMRFVVAFDGRDVRAYNEAVRTGTIAVAGGELKFAIACPHGDCSNTEWVRVGFDHDGNGAVDLESEGSYERYTLRDRTVVAFDRGYDFEISPGGERLTLRRSPTPRAPRPTLLLGTMAPTFDAVDDHARYSLASARGKVVLIDFYSPGCHFCIEDLPWLAQVHDRYAQAGLDLVTIATTAAPAIAHPWPTIVERDPEPVAALYRVNAYPAYFVVDRRGAIACARCRHDDVDRALEKLLAHTVE
jgi:thiol-disulfide isomerase/thioredoxin